MATSTRKRSEPHPELPPCHPGEILRTEFLEPLSLSSTKLAIHMGIAASRVTSIVKGDRSITADTAFRLAMVFGTSTEFWMNLQSNYDLAMLDFSGEKEKISKEVRELVRTS